MTTQTESPSTWLSPAEAAIRLGRSRRTVERAIKDGSLPSFKWRGCRMVDANALDRAVMKGSRAARTASEGRTAVGTLAPGSTELGPHVVDKRPCPSETQTTTSNR